MNEVYAEENKVEGIPLVTEDAKPYLNPSQEIAYREHRHDIAEWMLSIGKNPKKAVGYAHETAKTRMSRLDLFSRFVWDRESKYVQEHTPQHANAWMRWLARQDFLNETGAASTVTRRN